MATNKIYEDKRKEEIKLLDSVSYEDIAFDGVESIGSKIKKQWTNSTEKYENIIDGSKKEAISIGNQLLSNMYVMYSQQLIFNQINNIKRNILSKIGNIKGIATSLLDNKKGSYGGFVLSPPIKEDKESIKNIDDKVLNFVKNSDKTSENNDDDIVKVALGKRHEYFKNQELDYIILKNELRTERVMAEIRGGALNPQLKMKEIFDLQKGNFGWNDIDKNRIYTSKIYTNKEYEIRNSTNPNWDAIGVSSEISAKDEYIDYYKKTDTVPFYIYDLINKNYIFFKNTITTITDSLNFSWNESNGIGKPDPVFDFSTFDENQNITFTIVIENLEEINPTFNKINYLARMCYPNYNRQMQSNIIRITVGDFIKDQLIFLNSLFINPDDQELGWFFRNNNFYSDNVNEKYYSNKIDGVDKKLPMKIDITMDFTIMFDELPENKK